MEVADEEDSRFKHHRKGGLLEILSTIEDPRTRKPEYPLRSLLTAVVLAFLRGKTRMNEIPGFLRSLHHKQIRRIGFNGRIPDESTFRRVFWMLNFNDLEALLAPWFAAEGLEGKFLALDGKRQCGAHNSDEKPPEILNVVEHNTGAVVGQAIIEKGRDEREALKRFVLDASVKAALLTADAIHTNSDIMQLILEAEADYFLYVKKNQPIAWNLIENLKLDEHRGPAPAHTIEHSKGREEVRELWFTPRYCKHRSDHPLFPGAGLVGTIIRTITDLKSGKVTREKVHFVTSLEKIEITPAELLGIARGHWSVEAKNHYVKDTTMGEDKCRCRRKGLPQVLGTLRNVALKILRKIQLTFCTGQGRDTIPEAMRYLQKNGGVCSVLSA